MREATFQPEGVADQNRNAIVLVVAVGIRKEGDKKDIYALAKKLIRARLLEPTAASEEIPSQEAEEDQTSDNSS